MTDEKIISVRNLLDSAGTPLRRFYGVLDSYSPEEGQFGTRVVMNFKTVEVLESIEPYNFPTAVISIKLSNRKRSAWGIFSESLAKLISNDQDLADCIDKKLGLVMTPGHNYGTNRETGEDMIAAAWEVFEVEGAVAGAAATSSAEQAKKLLDDKTLSEFNKVAYADPIIRKDADLQRSITDRSFVKAMLATGEFTKDEVDIYHRVSK